MPICSSISNTQEVTLTANDLPAGFCHTSLQGTHNTFTANTTAQLSGNVAAFTAGYETPSAQDRTKLWFRLSLTCQPMGFYSYNTVSAAWEPVYSGYSPDESVINPVGSVLSFAGEVAPNGWFICDGLLKSRTVYANLFGVIGTKYGAGDGSSTYGLPDLRGEFVRGHDAGRGVDTGRVLGSGQAANTEPPAHDHYILNNDSMAPSNYNANYIQSFSAYPPSSSNYFGGSFEMWYSQGNAVYAINSKFATGAFGVNPYFLYRDGNNYTSAVSTPFGTNNVPNKLKTSPTGGAEQRPRNVALNYIIKY